MPENAGGQGVHLIDDDKAARESLAFLLGTAGFKVKTYESAVAFLRQIPELKSGCIITDVRMAELSGIDLLRRLRALKVEVPVIVITGHGDVPLAVEAMKRELEENHSAPLRASTMPTATAIGITTRSETRPIATATNTPAMSSSANRGRRRLAPRSSSGSRRYRIGSETCSRGS